MIGPWKITAYQHMRGQKPRFVATRRNGLDIEAITKRGLGDSADAKHFYSEAAARAAIAKTRSAT